jgi:Rps23 Pro-64 3,4-dihydroxylase Tpa1-like proline 4-hydroxylase
MVHLHMEKSVQPSIPGSYTREGMATILARRLAEESHNLSLQWQAQEGDKTRYFIIDDLLPAQLCADISLGFPQEFSECLQRSSFRERKKTLAQVYKADPVIDSIIYAFQQKAVVDQIELITSFGSLIPDMKLFAGGISMMNAGDFLNPHIDNSHNIDRSLYRRLNLLFYTSPGWKEEFGGSLKLWNDDVTSSITIPSKFNRLVVMETNKTSWHSVSPVKVSKVRQCVSNYYFTKDSPVDYDYYHVTSFLGRPEQPLLRTWGRLDNAARNIVAKITGKSRGWRQQNDGVENSKI